MSNPNHFRIFMYSAFLSWTGADKIALVDKDGNSLDDLVSGKYNRLSLYPAAVAIICIALFIVSVIYEISYKSIKHVDFSSEIAFQQNLRYVLANIISWSILAASILSTVPLMLTWLFDLQPGENLYVGPEKGWVEKPSKWYSIIYFLLFGTIAFFYIANIVRTINFLLEISGVKKMIGDSIHTNRIVI